MPSCAVANCSTTGNSLKTSLIPIRLHHFPKDKKIANIWREKCKRKGKVNLKHAVMCSLHFEESEILIDKVNRTLGLKEITKLKHGALPSRNLPLQVIHTPNQARVNRATKRKLKSGE